MNIRRFRYVFQNEAGAGGAAGSGDAGAGGASAGAGSAAAGGAGEGGAGAGASGAPAGGAAAAGSALAAGAGGGAGAAAGGGAAGAAGGAGAAAGPNDWIPEKHRVFGEDGKTLNLEASARKVAEAHGHLEKRMGSGDVPPKTAADYKVTVPDALKDKINAEELQKAENFKGFAEKAHALKLTQEQFDGVTADFLERSIALQTGMKTLSEQEAVTELRKDWTSDADYTKNMQAAYRAGAAFGDINTILEKYGNDPVIVRMLAKVGAELAEDRSAPAGATAASQASMDTLTKSKAYMDPLHPEHAATKQKVAQMHQQQYGDRPKGAGPIIISSI